MAIVTYPLNNITYAAEDAELYNSTRTSGVFAVNDFDFTVTEADNNITIGEGLAWIRNSRFSGKAIGNKTAETLTFGVADASFPRIDVVALQFDKAANETKLIIKQGTAASSPAIPAIVQTEVLYELYLYAVRREAGATVVLASNVTDLRPDEQYCGLMRDGVTRDTAVPDGSVTTEKFAPDAKVPFAALADMALNGVYQLSATKSGTVFALSNLNGKTGLISCVFTAPADYAKGNTFTIDGTTYTVKRQDGSEAADNLFVSGAAVSCIVDTNAKTVNFKSSGGSLKYATGTAKPYLKSAQTGGSTYFPEYTDYYCIDVSGLDFKPYAMCAHGDSFSMLDSDGKVVICKFLYGTSAVTRSLKDGKTHAVFGNSNFTIPVNDTVEDEETGEISNVTWHAIGF